MAGIEHLKELLSALTSEVVVAVKESKQFAAIVAEAKDLDAVEINSSRPGTHF